PPARVSANPSSTAPFVPPDETSTIGAVLRTIGKRSSRETPKSRQRPLWVSGVRVFVADRASAFARHRSEVERREVFRKLFREVGPPEREVDDGLEEPELVAGVVADAVDFAGVDRAHAQQFTESVGQLDLARAVVLDAGQRREDIRREHV